MKKIKLNQEECEMYLEDLVKDSCIPVGHMMIKRHHIAESGLRQLIEEHFELQLTRSECNLIEFALKPLEEELGMDITLLIDKLRRIQNTLPKEEGVVTCVEID